MALVVSISGPTTVASGGSASFSADADDTNFDNNELLYDWSVIGGGSISGNATATFNAPTVTVDTVVSIRVQVENPDANVANDSHSVTVTGSPPPSQTPSVSISGPSSVVSGHSWSFTASVSNIPAGEAIDSYAWGASQGSISGNGFGAGSGTAPNVSNNTTVTITVTVDFEGGTTSVSDSHTVTVTPPTATPSVTISGPSSVPSGSSRSYTANVSNEGSLTVSNYNWSATRGTISGGSTGTYDAPSVQSNTSVTISLTITFSNNTTTSDTLGITVQGTGPSPSVSISGASSVESGEEETYTANISNQGGRTVDDYAWTASRGSIGTGSSSESFIAPNVSSNTTVTISVTVSFTDGTSSISDSHTVTVTPPPPGSLSVIISGDSSLIGGETETYRANVSNEGSNTITYAWTLDGSSVGSNSSTYSYTAPFASTTVTIAVNITLSKWRYD